MLPNYLEMCCSTFTFYVLSNYEREKKNEKKTRVFILLIQTKCRLVFIASWSANAEADAVCAFDFSPFQSEEESTVVFFSKSLDLSSSYAVDYCQITAKSRRGTKQVSLLVVRILNWG